MSRFLRTGCVALTAALFGLVLTSPAFAYRPFDSTDAGVAPKGDVEIEVSPVSFRREEGSDTYIAPQLRLNYGFAKDWEIVLEGQGEFPEAHGAPNALLENALSLKHVLREGSLQDKTGLSIATELSVLLPGIGAESGVGAMLTGIIGQQWDWGAVHLNAGAGLSHEHRAEIFLGGIVEGPHDWPVRPVAELIYERSFGIVEEYAALVGAIWQVKDGLAFDAALRQASVAGKPETEIRIGLTFDYSLQ
jgi:hypothetical protein